MSRVLFRVWFSIQRIIKNARSIIQCMVQDSAYYYKISRVFFSVWFSIQRIIKKCPEYYSAYGLGVNVLFKNVQCIIQRKVQYSAYYKIMSRVLFNVWFRIWRINKRSPGYYSAYGSYY